MTTPSLLNLSAQQLRRAAELKDGIERLQAELNRLLGTPAPVLLGLVRTRRKMSVAAIARIRASQRARWAKIRAARGIVPKIRKRRVSAAGRARLAAIARARWQKAKAAGRSKL
jgi:hypothetical protein